jgi:cell wall-associated NlpC family hydrolase
MKKLVIAGLIALTLSGSTSASAETKPQQVKEKMVLNSYDFSPVSQTIQNNTKLMNSAFVRLSKTVGKTWYVFSGSTPQGWDCSGLTVWFYGELGVELEHRASSQHTAGVPTKAPILGDLVLFKYKGYKTAYHVGVYIGDGKMIHAPKPGQRTAIDSVETFAGDYSSVSYRRILETKG